MNIQRGHMDKDMGTLFREEQHFRQPWIWIPILAIACVMWYGVIQQVVFHEPFGSKPAPTAILVIFWMVFGIGFPIFFMNLKMVTEVRPTEIYISYLVKKRIPLGDVEKYYTRIYRPIMEYGGWGIKFGFGKGIAYNVSGNRGVQLELNNGKKILIGSQKPEELETAIQMAKGNQQPRIF